MVGSIGTLHGPSRVGGDLPRSSIDTLPVETARVLATALLVSFHVIGPTSHGALQLAYPHPARIFADFFIDLRMPLFACIAGVVYAYRPLHGSGIGKFVTGKVRRLLIPGATAVILSALAAYLFVPKNLPEGPVWHLAVFPYLHYWFLMSVFLIFVVYAPLDAVSRGQAALPLFVAATLFSLTDVKQFPNYFSINGAIYLLPYFLLGVLFYRMSDMRQRFPHLVLIVAIAALALGAFANIAQYLETGSFSRDRRDLQSVAFGMGACILAMTLLPRLPILAAFGAASFTIYLYHPFATSGARRILHWLGLQDVGLHIVVGLIAGMVLPVILHKIASRYGLGRALVLGLHFNGASGAKPAR